MTSSKDKGWGDFRLMKMGLMKMGGVILELMKISGLKDG